jgi:hypothetical protein
MTILIATVLLAMMWLFALAYYLRMVMIPTPQAKR